MPELQLRSDPPKPSNGEYCLLLLDHYDQSKYADAVICSHDRIPRFIVCNEAERASAVYRLLAPNKHCNGVFDYALHGWVSSAGRNTLPMTWWVSAQTLHGRKPFILYGDVVNPDTPKGPEFSATLMWNLNNKRPPMQPIKTFKHLGRHVGIFDLLGRTTNVSWFVRWGDGTHRHVCNVRYTTLFSADMLASHMRFDSIERVASNLHVVHLADGFVPGMEVS